MDNTRKRWITPFVRQSFVSAGVAINIAQFGLVAAYVVSIVPQLRLPGAEIPMDVEASSWFASLHGMTLIVGTMTIVKLMSKYGRWVSNVCSAGFMFSGWLLVLVADSVTCLLVGRFLKGISLGFILTLGPIIIGECTSPHYRGSFLGCTTATMSIGSALIHLIGYLLHWRTVALICTVISFINLLISIYSPESPSWLATRGRYDECRKVFRWLRGPYEEEELQEIIQATMGTETTVTEMADSIVQSIKNRIRYMITVIKKKEVYKPIVIGVHTHIICYWCGMAVMSSYPFDIIIPIVGAEANAPLILATLDIQRLISNSCVPFIVKKFKRKTLLLSTISLNIACLFIIAAYAYAKEQDRLPFDHPVMGILLLHIQMLSMATGGLPLPIIIAGETYPLQYRGLASSVTMSIAAIHLFLVYKTFLQTVEDIKIYGAYMIYGVILIYSLSVAYYFLPETKDRTLQDIEDEFRGEPAKYKDTPGEAFLKDTNKGS